MVWMNESQFHMNQLSRNSDGNNDDNAFIIHSFNGVAYLVMK
jgi:hypothetical protein